MITYARRRHAVDLEDLRLQHEQARKDETMKKGAFGVDLNNDFSPLYVVQEVQGLCLLCSTRFDDPPCSWVTIAKDDFWPLA